MDETTLTIRIEKDLKEAAAAVAKQRDESLSQVLRKFLRDYVQKGAQGSLKLKD
jgi:antitoxin component of RelBE/YafQ-DinJ toxin-antitoxin module